MFSNLTSPAGLKALDEFLVDKSYIEGFEPSQADVSVFEAVGSAPDAEKYPNVARWYAHIASYGDKAKSFPGEKKPASAYGPAAPAAAEDDDDDDDDDLFGSDSETDEEAEKLKAQRLAEYRAKKAQKPQEAAKSLVILDVKPWDDETPMPELEKGVREIAMDGLLWGSSKLVDIGYGIKKLQITCVIEDDKVGTDDLIDNIMELEDYVQSVDIASFNKL